MATFGASPGTTTIPDGVGLSGNFSNQVVYYLVPFDSTAAPTAPPGWTGRGTTTYSVVDASIVAGGALRLTTGNVSGNVAGIRTTNAITGNSANPKIDFLVATSDVLLSTKIRIGFRADTGTGWAASDNFVIFEYGTIDTFWFGVTGNGSVRTSVTFEGSSTQNPGSSGVQRLTISQSGTTSATFTITDPDGSTYSDTISTDFPTSTEWYIVVEVETGSAASRSIDLVAITLLQEQ